MPEKEKNKSTLRTDARVSYKLKRTPVMDTVAGIVSIILAAVVWYFCA